ncbi:MAG: hypothetical protein V7767_04655 [Leeuwenhoekiella sp.]
MTKNISNKMYTLNLTPVYAVVTYLNSKKLSQEVLEEVRTILKEYFNGKKFILINQRKDDIDIEPTFYKSGLDNMIAVAVVSEDDSQREKLITEQENWKGSFAFFKTIEDAKQWAEHYF